MVISRMLREPPGTDREIGDTSTAAGQGPAGAEMASVEGVIRASLSGMGTSAAERLLGVVQQGPGFSRGLGGRNCSSSQAA